MEAPRFQPPARLMSIAFVALLSLTLLPSPGQAQTAYLTQWDSTEAQLNTVTSLTGDTKSQNLRVNPANGLIMGLIKRDTTVDDCWISITANDGATVVPNKAAPLTLDYGASQICDGGWIDADSLFLTNGNFVIRSDNTGQTFSSLTSIDVPGSTGESVRDVVVLDSDSWLVWVFTSLGSPAIRETIVRTDNAGSTWTYSGNVGVAAAIESEITYGSLDVSSVADVAGGTGRINGVYTVSGGNTYVWTCTGDTATLATCSGTSVAVQSIGSATALFRGASFIDGTRYAVPIQINTANSLFGGTGAQDLGLAYTADGGATYTWEPIFVVPSGASASSMHLYKDAMGELTVAVQFTVSASVERVVGRYDGAAWVFRENQDYSNNYAPLTAIQFATYNDKLYASIVKATHSALFLATGTNFATAPEEAQGSADEVAITDLVGFDVDESGNQMVTREGLVSGRLGRNVKLYDAGSLIAGASVDTDCGFSVTGSGIASAAIIHSIDGVNAEQELVSYLKCSSTDQLDVTEIRIRKATASQFGTPTFPQTCEGACYADIPDEELSGSDDIRRELSDLKTYPFDYSRHSSDGHNRVWLTWGFSTTEGDIGVVALAQVNGQTDSTDAALANIDPSGANQVRICTTRDTGRTGRPDYLYGISEGVNGDVKGFKINYNIVGGDFTAATEVSLTPIFPGGQVTSPDAIACAQNRLLVVGGSSTSGFVRLYNITDAGAAQPGVVYSGPGATAGWVALSPTGLTGAYQVDDEIHVFYTSNFTAITTLQRPDLPSGAAECGMYLSVEGDDQSLWWGACGGSGLVARFDVDSFFNDIVICTSCDRDSDGVPDSQDVDIDGDGICNGASSSSSSSAGGPCSAGPDGDIDGDGLNNTVDTDDDGDNIPDAVDSSTGGPSTSGTGATTGTGSGSSGGNILRPAGTTLPDGFTDATWDFLMGTLFVAALTVGLAIGLYAPTKSAKVASVGGGVGGVSGFLGAFAMGFWPWWMMLVLVVIAILVVFIGVLRGRGG